MVSSGYRTQVTDNFQNGRMRTSTDPHSNEITMRGNNYKHKHWQLMWIVLRVYKKQKRKIYLRKPTKSQYRQQESVALEPWPASPTSLLSSVWKKLYSKWMAPRRKGSPFFQPSANGYIILYNMSTGGPNHQHFSPSSWSALQRLNSREVWPRR